MEHQQDDELMNDEKSVLEGILQYYVNVEESQKTKKLVDLLDCLSFNQVIIFVSNNERAIGLDKMLKDCSFPSNVLHSGLELVERIETHQQFKEGSARILVSTDFSARGVSMEKVNIIINFDLPRLDALDPYLHRVQFVPKGLVINFVSTPAEMECLKKIQEGFHVKIDELPSTIEPSQYSKIAFCEK